MKYVVKFWLTLLQAALFVGIFAFLRIIPDNVTEKEMWVAILFCFGIIWINDIKHENYEN